MLIYTILILDVAFVYRGPRLIYQRYAICRPSKSFRSRVAAVGKNLG